ncbi:alkaline phosphatase [Ramlibacter sp. G-1-2-2]|uniref:Alkaline phosphatase n=1 Tax=Ramlibacter agri TaxID=2728837 RepID=A0A848HDB4_9BURK|nr:alkaline phosphatase D family protein [Ramlibacter agri]NML48397.1 alkaline phosphatase [Ramlibacter agri]
MIDRRHFLKSTAAGLAAPGIVAAQSARPAAAQGLQLGDPLGDRLMVWSRSDMPARMVVEWSTDARFANATRIVGPYALESSDFTARQDLSGLPQGREVFVRVSFQGLDNERAIGEPVIGRTRIPAGKPGSIRFLWGGDTAGQGWGINPDFGGMRIYESMRRREPAFFIHSGDTIYADGPIKETATAEGDQVWKNIVTPEVAKVAETLDEFRGRYRYNLLDANMRRFNAEVPQIWQWDDHEVMNNWSDSKSVMGDARYTEKNVPLMTARGARAFLDYAPMRPFQASESQRVYRRFSYGPLLEVFVLDMRSYRGPNGYNRQEQPGPDTAFLGAEQLAWLQRGLASSKATWKVVAADMPIGLGVPDGKDAQGRDRWEAVANGNGPVLGREFEFAQLFSFLKRHKVRNVVWLTADVHYAAAHYYDPKQAVFRDFDPFWEFVGGPLHAGTFGPNPLDNTFGPQVVFQKAPAAGQANLSPLAGMQFFGEVNVDARGLAVDLRDIEGKSLFRKEIAPQRA